jgi:hypothetical protein
MVLEAFVGPCPPGLECCHGNGVGTDNWVENLRWDTHTENVLDSVRHGTHNNVAKAGCPTGHPLELPNLVRWFWVLGRRSCLACHRARSGLSYAKKKGRPFDFEAESDRHYRQIMQVQYNT